MMINRCFGAAQNSCSSFVKKSLSLNHFVPIRTFLKKSKNVEEVHNREKTVEFPPLSGIDDPNFTDHFIKALLNPDFKKSYSNFSTEFKKLCEEVKTKYEMAGNHRIDETKGRIDMLFTFENEEDMKKFEVRADSTFLQGNSTVSLKLTSGKTALFSGNIDTEVPKDGNVKVAGYANLSSILQFKSFYRVKFHNWRDYTHLVFKVRGDGRTYVVLILLHGEFDVNQNLGYAHPLYTRGGPYWQIVKIPFSHFYLMQRGHILNNQSGPKVLTQIRKFGITAVGFDGPFQLEIDYIGLEFSELEKQITPYEAYR